MPHPSVAKAELHCHLEGAADPALVRRMGRKYGLDLSGLFAADGSYAWTDFTSFIKAYDGAAAVFRSFEDFSELAETYLAASAAEGVIYTEVFVSPDFARRAGISYADYLGGVSAGMDRAEANFGIVGRIIPLIERHHGPEAAVAAAQTAVANLLPRVCGFGMAGDERLFHPREFAPAFKIANEAGLPLTSHAGELCGPESVQDTIDSIPVKRIGHGVRSIEDPHLVRRLAEEGIVLECCPGSNIALGVFPDFASHPFVRLRDAGVKVTLNADDPPFFRTSMGREYAIARDAFGLGEDDLLAVTATAIEAAFCDEATKALLRSRAGLPRDFARD
ncbi:adenosine deaminase [Chthonobacter albigriseus]|uniref:adenosine deaminase n=1 Tax=Chthonobacter albigriseus TaxID=1683161 RepID=UPI0015EE3A58|nr:adenosine deaminase [Chthonobacter albigriseus]